MSYATATPRDVIAMNPNPARVKVADIQRALGIGPRQAAELRRLACQAPEVMDRMRLNASAISTTLSATVRRSLRARCAHG